MKREAFAWLMKKLGYPEPKIVPDIDTLDAVAKLDAEFEDSVSDAVDMLIDEASGFLDTVDDDSEPDEDDEDEEEEEDV